MVTHFIWQLSFRVNKSVMFNEAAVIMIPVQKCFGFKSGKHDIAIARIEK
jgi:hypothetical protein